MRKINKISYNTKPSGKKVIEILNKFPNSSENSLAKKLYEENPSLFNSKEHARTMIKWHNGTKHNSKGGVVNKVKSNSMHTRENPWALPTSDYEEYPPFIIPPSVKDLWVGSDLHFRFQDNKAISKALDYAKSEKINGILLNGDIMDCYQVSKYDVKPNKSAITQEFEDVRNFLKMLKKKFPNIPIYYKEGNHEERWEKNLRVNAPILLEMEEFQLDIILKLAEMDIQYIRDKRVIKYSGLNIIHGHEVPFSSAANGARALFLKTGVSTLASHVHRVSEHIEKNLEGQLTGSWTIGCLSGLNPEYAIRSNKYMHGFAHVFRSGDQHFSVKNFKMVDYKIL